MNKYLVGLIILLISIPSKISASTENNPQLDSLVSKVKIRANVFNAMNTNDVLHLALPPQYPLCLYVSLKESGKKNNVANDFLLGEIDFLSNNKLSTENISGLLAFGHAVFLHSYATKNQITLDKVLFEDQNKIDQYSRELFVKHSCVLFQENTTRDAIGKLIQSSIKD